jgi:hypothetical protein
MQLKIFFTMTILIGGAMQANESDNEIHFFQNITRDTHPAIPYILTWLDAQVQKDYETFAASLNSPSHPHLFVNLPGGKIVTDAKELLLRHKNFYASPQFQVTREELSHGMGNQDFFTCNVLVHVTLPDGAQRKNYIDMTFLKQKGVNPIWIPARVINTVVDSTQ